MIISIVAGMCVGQILFSIKEITDKKEFLSPSLQQWQIENVEKNKYRLKISVAILLMIGFVL